METDKSNAQKTLGPTSKSSASVSDDNVKTEANHRNGSSSPTSLQRSTSLDASTSSTNNSGDDSKPAQGSKPKAPRKRKKKVEMACVYCRRSHMICDDSRPCQRCIKRGIGHLCHDEPSNSRQRKKVTLLNSKKPNSTQSPPPSQLPQHVITSHDAAATSMPSPGNQGTRSQNHQQSVQSQQSPPQQSIQPQQQQPQQPQQNNSLFSNSVLSRTMPYNQEPFFYSEHAGSEFSSLNDFLSMIDDPDLVNGALNDDVNSNSNPQPSNNNDPSLNFGDLNPDTSNNNPGSLSTMMSFSPNTNVLSNPTFSSNDSNPQEQQLFQNQRSYQASQQSPQQTQQNQPQYQPSTSQPYQQQQMVQPMFSVSQQLQKPVVISNQHSHQPGDSSKRPPLSTNNSSVHQPVISDSARDKFFLTAADPTTEISPEERLKQVIKAKLEAGLLQPYNYAKGYARLQSYMDNYMNLSSRQRILKPLSIFRPAFRAIARTLKDVDLVLVEESFERMLLDYDRVFTSMAIPACLWRRTGEIYRGNKEFASLVGVMTDDLKDGKLAIYELMSEESAVNFWEKYGAIAFDKGQKAVLTSCNLRTKDGLKRKSCCFSFTIRRDRYNIPSCIVGNFIPIDP